MLLGSEPASPSGNLGRLGWQGGSPLSLIVAQVLIHSFHKYLLSTYCASSPNVSMGRGWVGHTRQQNRGKQLCPSRFHILRHVFLLEYHLRNLSLSELDFPLSVLQGPTLPTRLTWSWIKDGSPRACICRSLECMHFL